MKESRKRQRELVRFNEEVRHPHIRAWEVQIAHLKHYVRLYKPHDEVLYGFYQFPNPQPVK